MPSYCMTVLWRRRRCKVHSSLIFVLLVLHSVIVWGIEYREKNNNNNNNKRFSQQVHSSTENSKPASGDPSIQWKLEILTDLTAIQKPLLPRRLPAAARNADSQLWTLPSVTRGKNELLRCWQAVCASNCVTSEPSVQKQMLMSG